MGENLHKKPQSIPYSHFYSKADYRFNDTQFLPPNDKKKLHYEK